MKNFKVILIACFAFIFLASSGCSKEEEENPYTREQIIGKWYHKYFWEIDETGNGKWVEYPQPNPHYFQFNENGTFYNYSVQDDINSSWELIGKRINCKTTRYLSSAIKYYNFEIISITEKEIVADYKIDNDFMNRIKLIKESEKEKDIYTFEDVIGKWIYKSEFKDGKWIDYPKFGEYYNIFKDDANFQNQNETSDLNGWSIHENIIECIIFTSKATTDIIHYKVESIKDDIMIVIRQSDGAKLKYIKE